MNQGRVIFCTLFYFYLLYIFTSFVWGVAEDRKFQETDKLLEAHQKLFLGDQTAF